MGGSAVGEGAIGQLEAEEGEEDSDPWEEVAWEDGPLEDGAGVGRVGGCAQAELPTEVKLEKST